jgi:hypothetical protein
MPGRSGTGDRRARRSARARPSRAACRCACAARPAHARGQRHVLVVRAVGRGAPREELLLRHRAVDRPIVRVVVDHLVSSQVKDPRTRGVRRLQVGVALVMGMARAVVVERHGFVRAIVLAHMLLAPRRLVDVVAEERDQVGRIGDDVAVGAVPALLELLARGDRELQPLDGCVRRGRSACASGRALRVSAVKRYQYQRSGSSPLASTCTECAHSGERLPCLTLRSKRSVHRARSPSAPGSSQARALRRAAADRRRGASTARSLRAWDSPMRRRA